MSNYTFNKNVMFYVENVDEMPTLVLSTFYGVPPKKNF